MTVNKELLDKIVDTVLSKKPSKSKNKTRDKVPKSKTGKRSTK
jgi:hypothetical protein